MSVTFWYSGRDGVRFSLSVDVDERRPFNRIINDAEEKARAHSRGCRFVTAELPQQRGK